METGGTYLMQMTLGQKIKQLRRNNKMTQGELGKGLVTPSMISQIEADKASPSHKLLTELAERLGVTIQYFLEDIQTKLEKNGTLKYARMMMEAGNFKNAALLLRELVAEPVPHLSVMEIKLDLAYCLHKQGDLEKAIDLYEEISHHSISQDEPLYTVKSLHALGVIEYQRGNLALARFHLNKAAAAGVKQLSGDIDLVADVLLLLAKSQNQLGDHADALDTLRNAQSLLTGVNDLHKHASLSATFSEVYRSLGLFKKAEEYANEAITIYKSLELDSEIAHMKISLAQIMAENGKFDEALRLLEKCLEEADVEVMEDISYIHSVIAGLFFRLEKYDLAKNYCEKSIVFGDSDYESLLQAYRILSLICFKQEQYEQAIYHCEKLIHLCRKQYRVAELTRSFTLLSDIYKKQGNYLSATETFLRMQKEVENNLREKIVV